MENTSDIRYYSNAKLLITGEYLVMKGAKALAIPLTYGQSLVCDKNDDDVIVWVAKESDKIWFHARFNKNLDLVESNDSIIAYRLLSWIDAVESLKPGFKENLIGKKITTNINFDRNWGLGTSSTLITNLAKFAGINPFELHRKISKGSGYDIACAISDSPIFYQLQNKNPMYESLDWEPEFSDKIRFVYTGKKQNTDSSIEKFNGKAKISESDILKMNHLSEALANAVDVAEFNNIIEMHENLMSGILEIRPVKELRFSCFEGSIKSLGAWGGDFIMAASSKGADYIEDYFKQKDYKTILKFDDIKIQRVNANTESL